MRTRHLYAPQVALPRGARGLVLERTHEGALRSRMAALVGYPYP